jgi:chemotaxis regulatin CheY-phosphate phosphatase CheZ
MRVVTALLLCLVSVCLISGSAFAQTTSGTSGSSAQFIEELKDLNTRFTKATAEKRDYQEIREIRADIKKMIPAIRAKADDATKQNQLDENEINQRKGQVFYGLRPQATPSLAQIASAATPRPFSADYFTNTIDSLKRRADDLKRTLPGQIETYKKAIDEIDKERTAQPPPPKELLDQLQIRRQSESFALQQVQTQHDSLDNINTELDELEKREKALNERRIEQAALQKLAVDAEGLLDRLDERAQNILSNDNALNIFTMISTHWCPNIS